MVARAAVQTICKRGYRRQTSFQAVAMIVLSHRALLVVVQLSPKPQLLDRATGVGMAQLTEQEGGQAFYLYAIWIWKIHMEFPYGYGPYGHMDYVWPYGLVNSLRQP